MHCHLQRGLKITCYCIRQRYLDHLDRSRQGRQVRSSEVKRLFNSCELSYIVIVKSEMKTKVISLETMNIILRMSNIYYIILCDAKIIHYYEES